MKARGIAAVAGAALGVGAGLVAQRTAINRRRRNDPEGGEAFGSRRGQRSQVIHLEDGAQIFVEEVGPAGSKCGAIFIHGSCLRTDAWHYQLPGLGDRRLVFYDLRGHGLSQPKGDSAYTIRTLGNDLLRVMDEVGLEEAVLVGHSIGGMIALDVCKEHPELLGSKIAGVALLNTTHRPGAETILGGATVAKVERVTRRPLDALGSRADQLDRLRRVIKPSNTIFMGVSLAAFGPHASAKQVDFTYDMLAETPADVIFDLVRSYRDNDVTEHLEAIDVPALVIGGTHDRLTMSQASEFLAEHLPQGELSLLNGCGHMSMLERHRDVNRLLTGFFDDTLGKERGGSRR